MKQSPLIIRGVLAGLKEGILKAIKDAIREYKKIDSEK